MVVLGCLHYWIFTSVLLLSSWRQCNGDPMAFTEQPVNETVDRGGDVSFNCTYPHMGVNISWNGPGVEEGDESMETSEKFKTSTLTITNISNSHAGDYFCTAQFNETMVNSIAGTLSVNYVTVQFKLDVIMAHENQPVEIPINVTVIESPTRNPYLFLLYSEGATSTNKSINKTSGSQILQVPAIDQLTCMTSEIQVTVTTDDPLVELEENRMFSIHLVPTIGFNMSSYSVIEGDTMRVCITVMCGQLLQDELVILSIRDGTERAGADFIALNQMNITLMRNSSESYCVMIMTVFDDQTNMEKQFQIMMQPSASTDSEPNSSVVYMPDTTNITITNLLLPTIMPLEERVSIGSSTGFQINASCPFKNFQWQHNSTNITNKEGKYVGVTTENLTVMNVSKDDAGNYSCNVTTIFNLTVNSQQAQLKVFALPIITAGPVNITVNRSEAGLVSFSVTIDEALGEEFTYQWLKNGSDLIEMPGKIEGVNSSELMIIDAQNEDEGSYQCVIVNGAGDNVTSDKAFLSVVDLPAMPVITNVSASSTSITINWNQNLSSDVFWYELRYNFTIKECYSENIVNTWSNEWIDIINGSLTSYTLTNSSETPIEEDSAYDIFLTAVNSDGRSEASTTEISTLGAAPTGTPINLNGMVVNDRQITIQWEPVECSQRNGEIIGYNVTYYPGGENSMPKFVAHASDGTFTATGLVFETTYVFEVQAINSYGTGPPAISPNVQTSALQGIMIVYNGRSYYNSIVNLDAEGGVLQCFTDKMSCCRQSREGEWKYPNGSLVEIRGSNGDFYRTRGDDPGVVTLHWTENTVIPEGVFCCDIPPSQVACIGVYPEGAGFPMVVSITANPDAALPALVCTSIGGPATMVIWKVNNQIINGGLYQQTQRIASHQNVTFENILHIARNSIASYDATYECIVMNSVGNDSLSFRLEAIEIVSGNLSVGDNGSLLCKSIIIVEDIEWLNSDGEVIASLTDTRRLSLTFAPVNTSINNQMYTCRVNKSASVNKTITVSVTVEDPLDVMIDAPSSVGDIGGRATINCTATIIAGVSQLPTLTLTHPNGINLSRTEGEIASIILDPVQVEDAGEYTCTGEIDLENITSAIVQVEQNITFKLPTPMIDVAYDESSLEVGSSTVLNCTVTNYSIDNFDASLNITWSRSGIVLSNDSDRVVILNIEDSSTSTSQLTLSPLSANDDNITCSVNVELVTPNSFIEMTPTVSKQVQLTIEEPDVVVLIASGSTFEGRNESAGTNFSLICMVGGIENFRPEFSFEWNHSNGTGFEEINITSNEIHFSPLKLSEAGIYMCQVSIRSSLLRSDLSFISMSPYIIRAFVPIPVVTAILPPQDIFIGSSPSVTCVAAFDESVDLPLNIIIMFAVDQTIINSIHSVHMENYMRYTRTFTIDNIQANQMGICSFQSSYRGLELSEFILDNQNRTFANVYVPINAAIITEITSSGENIAGEQYNLTCTIVINGTHDTPRVNITWNSTLIPADTISYDNGTYISILQFDPLQESHHDHYQCSVAVADIVEDEEFYLNVQVPIVNATINRSENIPVVGQPYTLTCTVSGDEKLDSDVTYSWTQNNGTETELEANSTDLSFSSLSLSNSGNYSCMSVVSSMYLNDVIISVSNLFDIQLQAPLPSSATIIMSPNIIFTGHIFSISCIMKLPPTVDIPVTVNIVWSEPIQNYTSPAPTMENSNEYSSTATFVSDVEWESVNFQCEANLSSDSPFITASESRAANVSVFVVGRPSQPTGLNTSVGSTNVEITWSTGDGDIVYGYELQYDYHIRQCPRNTSGMMINISNSTNSHTLEHLEEDSEFNISLTAFNPAGKSEPANVVATTLPSAPSGAPQGLNITDVNFTNVTIEWDPVECSQRNGKVDGYRLIYYPSTMNTGDNESVLIDGSNTNTFKIVGLQPRVYYTLVLGAVGRNYTFFDEESSKMVQTSVPPDVGVLLHGKVFGNNSIVSLGDIGEGRRALLCVTSETGCCRDASVPGEMREWYFPNGSAVSRNDAGHSFYRDRGPSIVRLNQRYNVTSLNGIFQCTIPSSITPLMTSTIHIGIYDNGQGIPQITSFTSNRTSKSLNCTSLGGPVTIVTWKINNKRLEIDGNRYQQTQVIVNSTTAEYANILYSNDISNLVGVFTCIVQNARGSSNKTISTNGVVIENIAGAYTVGSDANITCRSDTDAERMEWLTQEGTVIHVVLSESNVTQLNLTFTPISDSIHGQVYICRVIRNSNDTPEQNFTMNVEVPAAEMVLELDIVPMRSTSVAGESISYMCTVTKIISGLEQQPLAVWVENGTELTEQSESNATLTFDKLNTSDGKVYTCQGNLLSPALYTPLVMKDNYTLVVEIPTPGINVTLSSSTAYAGTNLSVICDISINTAVDSDISVDVTWFNGSSSISTETERVSVLPLAGSKPSFFSNLLIHPLIDVDDTSNFSCQASIHSDSEFIQQSNVGEGSIHIPVQQRTPSEPKIVIENITSTGIDLRWSQEAHDFIKGFTITATYMAPCNNFSSIPHNFSHLALTRQVNIAGLQEFSSYSIVITAFNDAGNSSSPINITTNSSEPTGSPNNIRNTSVNLTSIAISWSPISCIERNSIIHRYIVYYQKRMQEETRNDNISTMMTNATINNLDPRTNYEFEVQGINENGQEGPSEKLNVTTSAPTAVGLLFHDSPHGNKSVVLLDEIGEGADALLCLTNSLSCCEEHGDGTTSGMWYFPNSSQVLLESQASGHDIYITRGPGVVRLHRRGGSMMPVGIFRCDVPDEEGMNQSIYVGVYPDVPREGAVEVQNLRFDKGKQALSCTSIGGPPTTVTWRKDGEQLNIDGSTHNQTQAITNTSSSIFVSTLFIHYRPDLSEIVGNYTCLVDNSRVTNMGTNLHTFEIQGLKIAEYESSLPHGSSVHLNCSTDLAADTIEWLDTNGEVLKTGNGPSLQLIHTPSGVTNVIYICRINSRFGSQNKTASIHILQEEVSPSDSDSLIVIAIVVIIIALVIVVIVIIVVILLMRRKRQGKLSLFSGRVNSKSHSRSVVQAITPLKEKSRDTKKKTERLEMTTYKKYKGAVVSVDHFNNYVRNMHGDRDQQFENEYSTISKEPLHSYASSEIMVNRLRNRFGNIFPYDHSRVKLQEQAGVEHSDYINANYLDGYQKPSAYIAAQGPLPNTLDDFWRMIWEKRLTTIVMLTQCFEGKKKCECYWPININETFEPGEGIKVILTSMVPFTEYIIRKMTVTRVTEPQAMPLEVIQFHFVAWPDHGVPDNHALMLNFIRRVRKLHPYSNPCPLLVHCSAGVGRTGTFIVLDTMLERMEGEGTLNIYDYVKQLREQRVLMVQTLTQYIFIHDALSEFITYGLTEIAATDIRKVINQLNLQHDPCSASTGFEQQFQDLGRTNQMTSAPSPDDDQYSVATSEENREKNRYSNKLPNNFYRVCLKSTPSSDYINASFIDGYKQRKAYIATQGPLESTVCDFWRMVWENESKCVVLLSELKENGEEMCVCCWPTTLGATQTYGHVTVKLLAEENYGNYDLRKFEISEDRTVHPGVQGVNTAFTVTQLHFLVWPEHETPPITSSLIELVENVNKVQMGAGNKPMIIMCNDGVGRTGTFICIHAQLERLKTEGVVDFFQFIKSVRMHRAGLVSNAAQYSLCHEVVANYLDSFDTYANFKEVI